MLVLGGYGTAEAMLARLLLERSDAEVVIAGRTAAKADALAAELGATFGARRCSARCVDAADPGGARRLVTLRVAYEDGYYLTAAAAAACLLQYLDGSIRRPGLSLQALAVEPGRFLTDLQKMGVSVSVREAPELAAR